MEASLNKVPTFIFGKTVFNKLPYVFDCNNRQNLININKLLKSSCRSKIDTTCIGENLSDISKKSFMSHNDINNEFGNIDQERFNHYLLDCFKNS